MHESCQKQKLKKHQGGRQKRGRTFMNIFIVAKSVLQQFLFSSVTKYLKEAS